MTSGPADASVSLRLLLVLTAYLLGTAPFASLCVRWLRRQNLADLGSGNLGATNVWRATGLTAGVVVACLDLAKGAVSVQVARHWAAGTGWPAVAACAAVIGHVYPAWRGFRGGKGVATACGAFLLLTPAAVGAAVVAFAVGIVWLRAVSAGSMLAAVVLPVSAWAWGETAPVVLAATVTAGLILFRHRMNGYRLWQGTEPTVGVRV